MDNKKLKLRRHETFSIREGWIEKGLASVKENEKDTFSKNYGSRLLGIGSSMIKSLKYWMLTSNIINAKDSTLTDFGEILYINDPYMLDDFSWWLLHYFLVTNEEESPVFFFIHNRFEGKFLDKSTLFSEICKYYERNGFEYNEELISEDISMYISTYYNVNYKKNPEDNMSSPLAKLYLVSKDIRNDSFVKKSADFDKLNYLIVYYALTKIYTDSFDISDAYEKEKSPCKVFNLDKRTFEQYLGIMKNKDLVTINKTAGLNTVYINKTMTLEEIINEYRKETDYAL